MRGILIGVACVLATACTRGGDSGFTTTWLGDSSDAGMDESERNRPSKPGQGADAAVPADGPDASDDENPRDEDPDDDAPSSGGRDADDDFVHTCTVGDENCVCYPNDTCNAALECDEGICRESSGGTGGSRPASVGAAGDTGEGGSTAMAGGASGDSPLAGGATSLGGTSSGGAFPGGAGQGAGGAVVIPIEDDRCATMLLLIDRSTSVFASTLPNGSAQPFGGFPDGWEAMRAAVATLEPYAEEVALSAVTFAAPGTDVCPVLQGADLVPALGAFDGVSSLLPPSAQAIPDEKADTPMVEALEAGYAILDRVDASVPRILALLSDGSTEMCTVRDRGAWCGQDPAIGAAQDAYLRGIETWVVGIAPSDVGDEAAASRYFLDALASAGRGMEVPPPPSEDGMRACLQLEYLALTGESVGEDFWTGESWRSYAQGTYGATGSAFAEQRFFEPLPDDVESAMHEMMNGVACR